MRDVNINITLMKAPFIATVDSLVLLFMNSHVSFYTSRHKFNKKMPEADALYK